MRCLASVVALCVLACAPQAKPGERLAWSLQLAQTALPAECGESAELTARALDVEVWTAFDGVQVLRFVSREPLSLGAASVVLPEGVWTGNGVFTSELPGQRLVVTLTQPADGGVIGGTLSLAAGACGAEVPFTIERRASPSSTGSKQFDVAVQSKGSLCAPEQPAPQHVQFEVWELAKEQLTLPASAERYGDGVTGALAPEASGWREGPLTVSHFADALQNRGTVRLAGCDVTVEFFALSR